MNTSIIKTFDAPASHTRHKTLDGRIANALDRAQASTRRVWRTGPHSYRVHSFTQADVWYTLTVGRTGIVCTCLAGVSRQVCKHAALLSLRLQREGKPTTYSPIEYGTELFEGEDAPTPAAQEYCGWCQTVHTTTDPGPYCEFWDGAVAERNASYAKQEATQWELDMAADELVDALTSEYETDPDDIDEPTENYDESPRHQWGMNNRPTPTPQLCNPPALVTCQECGGPESAPPDGKVCLACILTPARDESPSWVAARQAAPSRLEDLYTR